MDSYDLFGEDGTGMLEGLPELGGGTGGGGAGGTGFDPAPVTGAPRNVTNAYPTAQQQQPIYSQETPLQKLATFGGPDFNHMDPNAQSMYAQGYGTDRPMGPPPGAAYQHQRQMAVRPPSGASSAQYPYQTDNMYSMPDVQVSGMGDTSNMQAAAAAGWSHNAAAAAASYPGMHRYSQMSQYRQQSMTGYPHQQEPKQQFPTSGQHPMMQQPHQTSYQMQQRHTPHYPQAASGYPTSAASQSYAGYMHQRLPHHHQYPQPHHQMDMSSVSQTQQYAQMSHNQSLSHATSTASHMGQTPHPVGHSPAQTHPSPQQSQPSNPMAHPTNLGYNQSHQSMQSMQRAMEVPPSQQQFQSKHSAGPMGNVSPQYRAPFPQLSPQMSPRSQMSPRPTPTSQMSPRPSMSPAKPNMSPHPSPMQQTTLSPRPAANIAPKVSAPSPAPIPAYSQQSTLQALEQMVMPPSSTNSSEYPTYQSRTSLGPPQSTQNPLSPAMGMRNPLSEQQWPPVQSRQVTHLSSLSGSLNMMDQNPVPTSQSIPPSQSLPPSSLPNTQMPPAPNINVSYGSEEIRSGINNSNSTNLMEMTIREKESSVSQSIPVSSQNEFTSVQSPTTSIPDKMPSSTTNTEVKVPTSVPSVPSHPPTPTPTSTTDDNITNTQDTSLPSNSESVKQIDELSNTSSTSQRQTPSQSSQNNFTDFNCVSSMTGYPSQPGTPKSNKMDDLVQSNASIFSQDNSVSQESLPESNKSDHSSIHSPRLQSPISNSQSSMPLPSSAVSNQRDSRIPMYSVNYNVSTPSPTQSHSSIQTTNIESSTTTMQSVHANQMITSQVLPKISQHLSSIQNQSQQQSPSNNSQNQLNITEHSVSSNNNSLSSPPPVSGSIQNNQSQNNLPSIFTSNSMIRTDSPIPAQNGATQNVGQQISPETESIIATNSPSSVPSQNRSNTPIMLNQSIPSMGNQLNIPMSNQNPPISVQSNPISISIPSSLPGPNTMQIQNITNPLLNQNITTMSAPTSVSNQNTVQCIQSPSPLQSNIPMMVASQRIQTPPSIPMSQHAQIPHQLSNTNMPPHVNVTNLPSNNKPGMFDQTSQMMNPNGVPIGATNRGISPRITAHGMPISHPGMPMGIAGHPGMMSTMGGMMPGQDIPGYQTPISHHQERAALQQQLQEMYCMPPGPEHQEKITFLQERLNILSQHEASDQCNGGSQCILQSPMFNSQMIDSPQVSSTTGRGRGKGPPKPRKPRVKKGEKLLEPNQVVVPPVNTVMPVITHMPQQLPVSEDFVTPGAGLGIPSNEMSEFTDFGAEIEPEKKKKGRKPRTSNKPKDIKDPKDLKPPKSPKEPKMPKERKKREAKDPKEPKLKRKYVRKKKTGDSEESATDESFNKSSESIEEVSLSKTSEAEAEAAVPFESKLEDPDSQTLPESSVPSDTTTVEKPEEMQADSQTPAEGSTSIENDDKKDEYNFDDDPSPELVELPKRSKKAKSQQPRTKPVVSKRSRRSTGTGRKRRGTIVPESDGENEDMISTPPPSPPDDGESSSKRRSARNTQRKKYIDDVMLRFSDDDAPPTPTRSRKPLVPSTPPIATAPPPPVETPPPPSVVEDGNSNTDSKNQMNYVYVNPTEEDSMVVQYVLSARMTRRKKKKGSPVDESKKEIKEGDIDIEVEKKEFSEDEEEQQTVSLENHKPDTKISDDNDDDEMEDVEEYFVKYRNFSYLHCEWKTEDELYKGDRRIANKIKRFRQKQAQQMNIFENLEEEPFNPDYVEVDRVLDLSEHTDSTTGEVVKHYLVKWRALQYEDCTWELEEDVDPIKIQQYERFNKIPPKDTWKVKKRPTPDQWTKLETSPIYKGGNSLREYQLEGLNWLLFSWFNGRNCILADEMGLGKTIQSLTFLHAVSDCGVRGPFLVIAPLSTIPNWQREIESWTDMNVIVYHGSATSRNMLQEYEMYYKNEKGQFIKDITKFNILITTFEIIVTDFADLKGFNWRICVIDEAHRLKNRNCKLLEGLRQLTLEHRVLLSGTPLQNNVNELFSLLNFLEPTQFSNNETFVSEFGQLKTEQEVQKLQILLKPMMLRRLKEDVEKSLAPKEETVVEVELTNIQKKYYRGILERNFSFLSKGTTHANIPNLMNTMMELRKCCIHPYLLNGAEEQIQYDYKNQCGEDCDAYYKALIQSSGKMVLIDKLLPKLKANGHRVLIFSQMVKCLDILEDYLMYKKYPFERIDGRIRGNLRQAAIDRFSRPDSDRFVFLLCTKAGGLGINLTAADTVIIYDSDWNPQNDLQAQARCHRIGQQKMVKIYRLLCRNTYEREMFDKASLKLGLDKAILQSMNTAQGGKDAGNRQLSKKEIEDLLKKGAYGALLDEDDGDKFCEEDIDVILARRTQVITMESEKGSTFSKASFASSANRSDIAIDDPDFWNKWAKKAEIDTTEKDENEDLVISEPRRRTQIKRYGHDESAIDMSELESSSDSDPENEGLGGLRKKKLRKRKYRPDDYIPREGEPRGDIVYGSWARRECFMVERGLLTFGWGRWTEILVHSQLRKGWKETDIEDCARVILLYCLRFYRGDEKIRSFIWDLIAPSENGEQTISKNHHGLKDPVPRGIRNKHKKKDKGILTKDLRHPAITDPNHWSKHEKYDGDIFLESNYKKHLGRHANKVLLRVRMLYYIKHEIIGDLVQHIADGVHASALPIYPPVTEQLPCVWWDAECDKSLLIGTWKHGYENYTEMRADPTLCFLSRCGPPSDRDLQMATNIAQPPTPALNEDDVEDEDTNEESSVKFKNRDPSDANSEIAEPSPGPSGSSETQPLDNDDRGVDESDDKNWPSITDLNTRLRRVITSYQRNCRKEEQKLAASKAKTPQIDTALSSPLAALAQVSQQFDPRDAAALGLQGWDLQQLALYLLMERQGKQSLEPLRDPVKEREKSTIGKRWSKREEADFFRVASSYGVIYYRKKKSYDWIKFKQLAKLEKKSDEELTDYYKHFVMMCKKQTGMNVDENNYDNSIEHISEEKARRTLERLELLSRIREEIITHPKLDERLRVCLTSADMPEWWIAGKHDRDLLLGVAKHGLGRTDYYLLNDPDLSFHAVLRKQVRSDMTDTKDAIKLESHEDILKFDKDEILVKLEKGEGTLKIEKVAHKKEPTEKKVEEDNKVNLTIVKSEVIEKEAPKEEDKEDEEEEDETKCEVKEELKEPEIKTEESDTEIVVTEKIEETETVSEKIEKEPESEDLSKPKEEKKDNNEELKKLAEAEADLCSKQAAELKAMFPDLEVIQPLSRLSQVDTFVLRDKPAAGALDFSETTVAQLFNNAVKWPKEYAIQVRLQHIIYAVETKEWPVTKNFSAYATGIGNEFDIPIHEIPSEPIKRETSTPLSIGDTEIISVNAADRFGVSKKRKRHIAIDVETERAKLHALLNNSHATNPLPSKQHQLTWENEDSEESRRSTPVPQSNLQPPPAHQQTPRMNLSNMKMPYDLQYHPPVAKTIGQTTVIPGTSSTLTPIDLSSGIPKPPEKSPTLDSQSEVQDFSVKKSSTPIPTSKTGNKLDDTLSKLMKRKNCPEPEPLVGKEKKRKKLDEIVLGLSAAKEQSLFTPETSKKQQVTPSVTVTPTSAPVSTSHNPTQKPFTITVTSVPSTAPSSRSSSLSHNILPSLPTGGKDSFSTFLAQAEQQNMMLKKQQQQQQQQQRKSYEAMIADIAGKDSFSSFLAQAEEQNMLLKKQQEQHQQQQRKSYEAMIADIGKVSDFSSKVNSYSHEAKVNKWLAEQNAALAEQPLSADYLAARRRRPRVDPTLLDWKKLTGDENVSVIHRVTGKKLTGPKAPTLKRLGQWLMENPMYDIDPKWSELVKERGNLSHDLQKRLPGQPSGSSSTSSSKSKTNVPGRPPVLSSPTGSTSSVSSANLTTSMPSSMSFPSLGTSTLAGLNSNLLTGLSGLGQFDPKTNPLLMPFAGLPNMNALGSMGGLSNLTNMNLFANLAGLGLPGLGSMDPSALAGAATDTSKNISKSSTSTSKSSKPQEAHSSSKSQSSSSLPTTNPFPFFFPNPSLLYTPLGLGGLNPFTLQPGMSAAYDTLAQQCGLLNGNMNPAASPNSSSKMNKLPTSRPLTATTTTSSGQGRPRSSSRDVHLQQLLLPPDTQILESISKAANLDITLKQGKSDKKEDKRKALENLRGMLPTDFSSSMKEKKTALPNLSDFTKLLEAQVSQNTKKSQEQQMKEALEHFSRTNIELVAKAMSEEQNKYMASVSSVSHKRPRVSSESSDRAHSLETDAEHPPMKRIRDASDKSRTPTPLPTPPTPTSTPTPSSTPSVTPTMVIPTPVAAPPVSIPTTMSNDQEGVDIEALLPPSTVVKASVSPQKTEKPDKSPEPGRSVTPQEPELSGSKVSHESPDIPSKEDEQSKTETSEESETPPKKNAKRTRGKRKSGEVSIDHESVIAKKNLRSSASRSAAAAAARQKMEAENAQRESENNS